MESTLRHQSELLMITPVLKKTFKEQTSYKERDILNLGERTTYFKKNRPTHNSTPHLLLLSCV